LEEGSQDLIHSSTLAFV